MYELDLNNGDLMSEKDTIATNTNNEHDASKRVKIGLPKNKAESGASQKNKISRQPKKSSQPKDASPSGTKKTKATEPTTKAKKTTTKPKKSTTTKAKKTTTKPKKSTTTKAKKTTTKPKKSTTTKAKKTTTKPKKSTTTKAKKTKSTKSDASKTKAAKTKKGSHPDDPKEDQTPEEKLEEQLSDDEIENFQIEKVDMNRLTNKVCDLLAHQESDGILQNDLWKRLKLAIRDGSRLSLKLERLGLITREKIIEKGRWTYRLYLKKTPISTQSIMNAPCLVCNVEQKCSIDGEISPRTCQLIEDWVITEMKKPKKHK